LKTVVTAKKDVRKYAAEHGISEEAAIEEGLKQKATESRCGDATRWTGSPKGEDAGAAESIHEGGIRNLRENVTVAANEPALLATPKSCEGGSEIELAASRRWKRSPRRPDFGILPKRTLC
jgi:hypothetical protein